MSRIREKGSSVALIVSVVALMVALGGGAVAGVAVTSLDKKERKQVKKISKKQANKRINKRAPNLSVANANFAAKAQTADTATNAQSAENAQNATNAVNAQNATNAVNAQSADDADRADVLLGVRFQTSESAQNSSSPKIQTVTCPGGSRVLGTGAKIDGGNDQTTTEVAIQRIDVINVRTQVQVIAYEIAPGSLKNWSVEAQAICGAS